MVPTAISAFLAVGLDDFVTPRYLTLFEALKLTKEFLFDPEMWTEREDYQQAKVIQQLRVVNAVLNVLATYFNLLERTSFIGLVSKIAS